MDINMNNDILVSIAMLTYNHEKYIRESIESVLIQKVNFKYEIIIGDDASNDKTQDILRDYQRKYPDKIKLILRKNNVGPTMNFYDILMQCQGKYIATLEGDDYWADENKLCLQAKFLESNSEFIGVSHSCNIFDQNREIFINRGSYYYKDDHEYGFNDFKYSQFPGHTSTMFYRNIFLDKEKDYSIIYTADRNTADRTIVLLLVLYGKIFCMGKTMSTYRKVIALGETNINSLYKDKNTYLVHFNYMSALDKYSVKICGKSFVTQQLIDSYIIKSYAKYLRSRTEENRKIFETLYGFKKNVYLYYLLAAIKLMCINSVKNFIKKVLKLT